MKNWIVGLFTKYKRMLPWLAGGIVVGMAGIVFLVEFDHLTATEEFCTTCHSMDFAADEYRTSVHYNSRSGVRAICGDCHVSPGIFAATWDHIMAYKDLVAEITGDYGDEVVFELHRPEMAFKTRDWFKKTGSATCLKCHVNEAIIGSRPHVRELHTKEVQEGKTCIECHYNLVHRKVPDRKTFKRDAWNEMIEQEFNLEPGEAAKIFERTS
ncbi:MAG: NapC/NirT family cytochrome c [Magnetococcales bacterium]|nr:NapC/NirT family cytochrome c [Magnetococcales bacterium]